MKNIINFANKVKSLVDGRMSNIANVEESPSTHAYAVGKQLIFNGLLCKATSAIAVGDTLAVGTNLALSDNVVEQIYSLNQGLTNSLNEISDMNNVLGAKNLLKNELVSGTVTGVTYTKNSDGSITCSNTATDLSYKAICEFAFKAGVKYILSGCPSGGSASTHFLQAYGNGLDKKDLGSGSTIQVSSDTTATIRIVYINGQTADETFYPMLRLASIQDDTYAPYSMTNRELSDNISNVYTKTEVNALTNGYILIKTHRVRVSSNSTTTTFAQLINSLYNDAVTYINTLDNYIYYQLASVRVTGNDCKYVTNDIVRSTTLSSLEQNLYMMIKLGTTLFMYYIEMRSNNASKVFKYNSDGTLTEVSTKVIGYAKNIDFYFNLYHINNN